MNTLTRVIAGYLFLLLSLLTLAPAAQAELVYQSPVYMNTAKPIDERVEFLLSVMTLEEKVGQMALVERKSLKQLDDIKIYHLGGLLSGAGSKPATNTLSGWQDMVAEYQASAKETRLGIPLLYGIDAIHGNAHFPGVVVFPHAIGLGAGNDPALVAMVASATARQVRMTGSNWIYGPNLDIPLDMRWGRVYEAFSDRTEIVSSLGQAYTTGILGMSATASRVYPYTNMVATAKHFVGLGSMQWGSSNNKNFKIDQGMTPASSTLLRTVYLPPFKAAIAAGAQSVMVGLNNWGDSTTITNKELITDTLKGQLGFRGFVVSDWYGVYEHAPSKFIATVHAINAGVDMVMLPFDYEEFTSDMVWANRLGFIATARIDDAVRRILQAKFSAGLFDHHDGTSVSEAQAAAWYQEDRMVAKKAVEESLVLLKNSNNVLPIVSDKYHHPSLIVAGSALDNTGYQSGAWTLEWQGVSGNVVPGATSIKAAIEELIGSTTKLTTVWHPQDISTTTKADIGLVFVGEAPYAEGWGDKQYPTMSYDDIEMIKKIRPQVDKLVVVVVSGRPLLIVRELPLIDGLVAAWLPGSAGEGVAAVLFGRVPFSGTLPVAWPKTSEQLPLSETGATADTTTLLFPTGFGLVRH